MPNGRCYRHGGSTPVGPASVHFKHGRHSLLMRDIAGLGDHYARALADPDRLRLDSEIALVDARVSDLLQRCSLASKSGQSIDTLWPVLNEQIEQRRKLVDTESKRLKDLHAMVSIDRVLALVAYLSDSVKRHVTDPKALTGIFADMRKMLKPAEE